MDKVKTTVGFVGLGVMGKSMAGHLLKAGFSLHLHTRTSSKAAGLIAAGALWEPNPAELAKKCLVIISMLGFPEDVETVYFGEGGLIQHAAGGSILVDMSTSGPDLALKISYAAHKKNLRSLDAPVSGGDLGAREARLSIMCGGDEGAFKELLPLFEVLGANIVYQGKAGSGQHAKLANQMAIAAGMLGVCEALVYSKKAALDGSQVLKSIESGAAGSWSLSKLGPRMLAGDFAPGFFIKHFIKDMKLASASAKKLGLDAQGLDLALKRYLELLARDPQAADEGTQALYKLYDK